MTRLWSRRLSVSARISVGAVLLALIFSFAALLAGYARVSLGICSGGLLAVISLHLSAFIIDRTFPRKEEAASEFARSGNATSRRNRALLLIVFKFALLIGAFTFLAKAGVKVILGALIGSSSVPLSILLAGSLDLLSTERPLKTGLASDSDRTAFDSERA
jgi:hypothetical protein